MSGAHKRPGSGRHQNALSQAALTYAGLGWYVFPLHTVRAGRCSCGQAQCANPGKHPRTRRGFKNATNDVDTIRNWWRRWPDANVGTATGSGSGLVVLDVDVHHAEGVNGQETLASLQLRHGRLPVTPEALTGGGGRHLLFRHLDGLNDHLYGDVPH